MDDKSEKLIIVGPSGSGKDFLLRKLNNLGLKVSCKVTTRPIRKNEVEGVNYYYTNLEKFEKMEFIVKQDFYNDLGSLWKYGILKEDFDNSQIFIMTPNEVSQIDPEVRKRCFIVYLDIDRSVRESRLIKREDRNDSILRRLDSDDIDFRNFNDFDLKITDPEFDAESVFNLMC